MTSVPSAVVLSNAHPLGDQRIARWVQGLSERGYAVVVVALDEPAGANADQLWGDASVAIVGLPKARRWGRVWRALRLSLRHHGDVVVAVDPELFAPVAITQRLRRGQSIADVHEDFPALAQDQPQPTSTRRSHRGLRAVVPTDALAKASMVGERVAADLVTRAAAAADITVVADDHVRPRRAAVRVVGRNQPLGEDDAALAPLWDPTANPELPVVYAGGLTAARGGLAMLEALAHSQGWTLDLFGPATPELADAIAQASTKYPDRLTWWGPISSRLLRHKLGDYAIGLCPLESNEAFRNALPAKIGEYHHAGLGIVATDLPRIRAHTAEPRSALLVSADDGVGPALGSTLSQLARDAEMVHTLQRAARVHRDNGDDGSSLSHAIRQLPLGSRRDRWRGPRWRR